MTEQATNVVRALRAALLLLAAVLAVISLVMMHSVAVNASDNLGDSASTSVNTSHGSDAPGVEQCPCPCSPNSAMVMAECTPVAALGGVVAVASLRALCVATEPLLQRNAHRAGAIAPETPPSLHVLSISRT